MFFEKIKSENMVIGSFVCRLFTDASHGLASDWCTTRFWQLIVARFYTNRFFEFNFFARQAVGFGFRVCARQIWALCTGLNGYLFF